MMVLVFEAFDDFGLGSNNPSPVDPVSGHDGMGSRCLRLVCLRV